MSVESAHVVKLIVHRVGNRVREERTLLSNDAIDAGPNVDSILVDHYLSGMIRHCGNVYHRTPGSLTAT